MGWPLTICKVSWIMHSLIISREGLILTLSILPCLQGRICWSTPCRKFDDERMSVLHQDSGGIGKSIPSALEISLDPRDFPRASPSGNLSGLRKSLGRRGWISQSLPRLGGARIHSLIISREVLILTLSIFNALKVCISWYSLATELISEAMTYKDHIIQYSPCALGSVQRNTSLGTVFPRTLPRDSISPYTP